VNLEDIRQLERASVYRGPRLIGSLARTAHGAVFEYDDQVGAADADLGVGFCMPPGRRRYEVSGVNLQPFFAGLLPEGLRLSALRARVKTSADDLFSLCLAAGADPVGDVSLVPEGLAPRSTAPTVDVTRLGECSFRELFEESLRFEVDGPAREPSVPGVQDKISAAMISFPLRGNRRERAHILKLNPKDLPSLVDCEAFFMDMARACGLDVAPVRVVRDKDGRAGLLVERFDRRTVPGGGDYLRLHTEDACQFLDRYPADKYRLSMADIVAGLFAHASAPLVELLRLMRLVAFCYLIGNGDLHARNVSLLVEPRSGRVQLSPAYDLLSTLPYGDRRMALKMDGRDDDLTCASFVAFAERHGLRPRAVRAMLDKLCAKARPFLAELPRIGLSDKNTADIARVMDKRLGDLA
jgi:serine/threonine-protein kinase HipA